MKNLPDVQEHQSPKYPIIIKKVGIENFKLPFHLKLRDNSEPIQLFAETSIMTNISENKKGISMSRLLLSIKDYLNEGLCWDTIKKCLDNIAINIETDYSYLKFDFDFPILKKSPLSENMFPIFYSCYFEGFKRKEKYQFNQSVTVQYSSYCPCSAALAKELEIQGFPHAQRSFAKIILTMDLMHKKQIWLEDIIDIVLGNIKTQPYPIIKRIDEQEISRIASENPIFVEDAIRIISHNLEKIEGINDWIVKCVHEESIHTHDAIAVNWKGVDNGFNVKSI